MPTRPSIALRIPASLLNTNFHMIAMATTGTTEGRKKMVRHSPTALSRRLMMTASPSDPPTVSGTTMAVNTSVLTSAAHTSGSWNSSM